MNGSGRLVLRLLLLASVSYVIILMWDTELRFFYEAFR